MNGDYKIFRIFCAVSIAVFVSLLIATGIMTAKYQTEQTVFGDTHSVVQVYEKDRGRVFNLNGRISETEPEKYAEYFDALSFTLFAPFNNLIELFRLSFFK